MNELGKKIENYLFGEISTDELSEKAFIIKKETFGSTITFSPKVFIPLTTMCQDSCGYCSFVKSPKARTCTKASLNCFDVPCDIS